MKSLMALLVCFAILTPSFGQTLSSLRKNTDGWYVITSDADFEQFRDSVVGIGNPYANALLTADVTVNKPIGMGGEQFHYRGTFDGQGHTITLANMSNTSETSSPWGLFQNTKPGCVIRNLKVSGKIQSPHPYIGSIVGDATSTKIENCISDVTVESTLNNTQTTNIYGDGVGGILGVSHGENFIENCAFIGTIKALNGATTRGIVGTNIHMVNIKSCYVMAKFEVSQSPSHDQFTDYRYAKYHTFLNNYYCKADGYEVSTQNSANEVTTTDVQSGKLCQMLNVNGRNGVVWYQHGDYPYPFKGADGEFISINNDVVYKDVACQHDYSESTHICNKCGKVEDGVIIDPLQQDNTMPIPNKAYLGYLIYSLNDETAEAEVSNFANGDNQSSMGPESTWKIKAVHIPETIIFKGKVYTVTKIGNSAFDGSAMEYCYIPKTVTRIENNAFNNCTKLVDLHIADAPGGSVGSAMFMGLNGDEELFYSCPLKKVYIGRDLKWATETNPLTANKPDEPFEDRNDITDVYFGPRVTRVGNYYDNDARYGYSYDLFNDCTGVKRVYLLGDEQSLEENPVMFYSRDGLGRATDYYINRNVGYTQYWVYSVSGASILGCLDYCENVTFGPMVKFVTKNAFEGTEIFDNAENTYLKTVDFTNAYRLEEIQEYAFATCKEAKFTGLNGQYPLKKIGKYAFSCCTALNSIDLGHQIETIEDYAFDRASNLFGITIPASLNNLGNDAFYKCDNMQRVEFEDCDKTITCTKLRLVFHICENLKEIYLGRQVEYNEDGDSPFIFAKNSLNTVIFGSKVKYINKLFQGINSLQNVSFEYSDEPIYFQNSPSSDLALASGYSVKSLNIDRRITNAQGTDLIGSDWGSLKDQITKISFGNNIDQIVPYAFANFTKLQHEVTIPLNIKTIGAHAFDGATELNTVSFLGAPEIKESAFANCTNLEYLSFMNDSVKIGNEAFANCNKIDEIIIVSDGNIPYAGPQDAFSDIAYSNTELFSAYETREKKVEFTVVPWSLFQKRPSKSTTDYDGSQELMGYYTHATIEHTITPNQYEIVYIPFEWDSYYFGANAEIYSLNIDNSTGFFEDSEERIDETFSSYNVKVTKADIDNSHTLPIGFYVIKSKFPDTTLNATRNFYLNDSILIDNTKHQLNNNSEKNAMIGGGPIREHSPQQWDYYYVFEDGVIKLLNDTKTLEMGSVKLSALKTYENDNVIANVVGEGNSENSIVLLTSKIAVPFQDMLEGYATFYNEKYNILAPEWCTVYVVTGQENGVVHMETIDDRIINAGQAVIIKTEHNNAIGAEDLMTYVTHGSSEGAELYNQNLLKGVSEDTLVEKVSDGNGFVFVLGTNATATKTGFYKYSDGKTLPGGRAYLLPSNFDAVTSNCLFSIGDNTTKINDVDAEKESEDIYDLSGRRLNNDNTKGIYIINNKKIMK